MPTVMIGLDGADPELIERWEEELPNFREIKEQGFHGELQSITPPITVPAWMCMLSGKKPGDFETWDFGNLDFQKYEINPVNSSFFKGKTMIDSDKKTISFRVPGTTPGYQINGDMISGFMKAEEMEFQSEELKRQVEEELEIDLKPFSEGEKQEIAANNFEQNVKIFKWLLENREFDRAFSVFRMIDTYMHDVNNEAEMKEAYMKADKALGEFRYLCDENNWNLAITSDHGSGETNKKLYLNAWLRKKGYAEYSKSEKSLKKKTTDKTVNIGLKLGLKPAMKKIKNIIESSTGQNLQPGKGGIMDGIDLEKSVAFSNLSAVSNYGAVWIHDEERFSKGRVKNREKKAHEIKNELEKEKYIKSVQTAEDLGFTDEMPDLIIEAEQDIVIGGEIYTNKFHHTKAVAHNEEGVWMGEGPAFENTHLDADILDVAPTIQAIDGAVSDSEGEVIEELLKTNKYQESEDIGNLDI